MGVQAECVLPNKDPRIAEAISVLEDILRRIGLAPARETLVAPACGESDYVHTLSAGQPHQQSPHGFLPVRGRWSISARRRTWIG
jgi:hypothetical protein